MAPGADQLMVDGDACDARKEGAQALLDAELAPLTGHGSRASAAIESCLLWDRHRSSVPLSLLKASHAIALRAAAEGVSLLIASGDYPGVGPPASDPDVTAVGGTTLGVGAHNQRAVRDRLVGRSRLANRQTAAPGSTRASSSRPAAARAASTASRATRRASSRARWLATTRATPGGRCPTSPPTRTPRRGCCSGRSTPDPSTGKTTLTSFIGDGTSQSTPLIAGMVADAEQGQPRNFGFLNPLLYSLAGSRAFHDILPVSSSDPQVDRAANTDDFY